MKFLLFWVCFLGNTLSFGQTQDWQIVNSVKIENLDGFSIDRKDQLFATDRQGNILQYSPDGDSLNSYSPVFRSRIDKLEAYWTVSLFMFSADLQQYELLDRFLRPLSEIQLGESDLGVIRFATIGNGNVLWLINETKLTLAKWDYRRNTMLQEQPLALVLPNPTIHVRDMAERKNLLFVQLQGEGVFIFDNQGNPIKHLSSIPDADLFFTEDFIFYIHQNQIHKVSYVTEETIHVNLPDTTYKKIGVAGYRVFLATDSQIDIYKMPPLW